MYICTYTCACVQCKAYLKDMADLAKRVQTVVVVHTHGHHHGHGHGHGYNLHGSHHDQTNQQHETYREFNVEQQIANAENKTIIPVVLKNQTFPFQILFIDIEQYKILPKLCNVKKLRTGFCFLEIEMFHPFNPHFD